MKFEHAQKGITKLFISELIIIISTVVATVSSLIGGDIAGIIGLVAIIMFLVAFILEIIGLAQAKKDDINFQYALLIIIFVIVLVVALTVLGRLNVTFASENLTNSVSRIGSTFVLVFVLVGIGNLAAALNNEKMAKKSLFLQKLIVCLFLGSLILSIMLIFFRNKPGVVVAATIMAIVGSILDIVAYVLYVIYLHKASKMLKENNVQPEVQPEE